MIRRETMSSKTVKCPKCGDTVSVYLERCLRCNNEIDEGKSLSWMQKSPATEENNTLFILWAASNGVAKIQQNNLAVTAERIDNTTWGNIFIWAYTLSLEVLKKNSPAPNMLPSVAMVTTMTELMLKDSPPGSPLKEFLVSMLGPEKTHLAYLWLSAFYQLHPSHNLLGK